MVIFLSIKEEEMEIQWLTFNSLLKISSKTFTFSREILLIIDSYKTSAICKKSVTVDNS